MHEQFIRKKYIRADPRSLMSKTSQFSPGVWRFSTASSISFCLRKGGHKHFDSLTIHESGTILIVAFPCSFELVNSTILKLSVMYRTIQNFKLMKCDDSNNMTVYTVQHIFPVHLLKPQVNINCHKTWPDKTRTAQCKNRFQKKKHC